VKFIKNHKIGLVIWLSATLLFAGTIFNDNVKLREAERTAERSACLANSYHNAYSKVCHDNYRRSKAADDPVGDGLTLMALAGLGYALIWWLFATWWRGIGINGQPKNRD
jgi:hypothetical protein